MRILLCFSRRIYHRIEYFHMKFNVFTYGPIKKKKHKDIQTFSVQNKTYFMIVKIL